MSSALVGHQIGQDRSSKRVRKGSPAVHRATNYQSSFKLKYGKYFTDRRYKKLPHQPEVLQREDSYYQSGCMTAGCTLRSPDPRESWWWLAGWWWWWWRSMLRCAPGFYTIAAGAITLGRAREQRAAEESRFELWALEASCQPSASPPPTAAYLPSCAICNTSRFYMPVLSGHHLVILHPSPSSFCWR